jgi:hypothetical protein
MSRIEKIAFPIIFAISISAYGMSRFMSSDAFGSHWVAMEDGFLEWLTVVSLMFSALLCWSRSWHLRSTATRTFVACSAAYGCVLLFGAGEEISWGQRIFGIETPEFLAEANAQKETNLHNLVIGGTSINKLVFGKVLAVGLAVFLILIPVAFQRSVSARELLNRFAVPVPRIQHTLGILAMVLLIETSKAAKRGEITEFALTSLVFLLLLNPLNRSTFRRPPVQASPATAATPQTGRIAA